MSEWRETRQAVAMFGVWRVLYWRFVYRHHMRWLHKRGRHHFHDIHPHGAHWLLCDWCGARALPEGEDHDGR